MAFPLVANRYVNLELVAKAGEEREQIDVLINMARHRERKQVTLQMQV
jgi:hypothetical protein